MNTIENTYLTPEDIQAHISAEFYFTAADGINGMAQRVGGYIYPYCARHDDQRTDITTSQLTFCVLVMTNGAKVVGINYGSIDPAHHCAVRGRKEARKNALEKVWELLGFELRSKLADSKPRPKQYTWADVGSYETYGQFSDPTKLDIFAKTYQAVGKTDGLTFGLAIEALKQGKRVARAGWNGKGMWLSLSGPGVREVAAGGFWSVNNADYAREQGGSAKVLPCITMKTATGEILMGWLASQTDMLAEDWTILD